MSSPSITGSVADLFATLGLDTEPLSAALSEAKGMITAAGADMSLSLGALEARFNKITASLSGGVVATTAYQAALQANGIEIGNNIKLTNEQAAAMEAELPILDQLIMAEQELLANKARAAAAMDEIEAQISSNEAKRLALKGEQLGTEQKIANERVALANQVAEGEYRAAAIEDEANGLRNLRLRATPGGIGVTGGITTGPVVAAAAVAAVSYELGKYTLEAASAAQETQNFADKLDITWNQARTLEREAHLTGSTISGLEQSAVHLADALEDAGGKGAKATAVLSELGVTGGSAGELLINFLAALSRIPDESKRMELLHEVFQRSSQQLVPLVKNMQALGAVVSQLGGQLNDNVVKQLEETNLKANMVSDSWDRLKERMATGIVGKITVSVLDAASNFLNGGAGLFNSFGGGGRSAPAMTFPKMTGAVDMVKSLDAYNAAVTAAKAHNDAFNETLDGMVKQLAATKKNVTDLNAALGSTVHPIIDPSERAKSEAELTSAMEKERALEAAIKAARSTGGEDKAAQDRNRIASIRLDEARKGEEALVQLQIDAIKHRESLGLISGEEAERQLNEQYSKQLDIEKDYEVKKLALENTKHSGVYEAGVEAALSTAITKRAALEQKATFDREDREAKANKAIEKEYERYYKALTQGLADYDAEEAKHTQAIANDKSKALQISEAEFSKHQTAQLELIRTQAAYEQSIGLLSANQRFAIDAALDGKEDELQRKSVQRELDLLETRGRGDITYASKKASLEAQLEVLADKRQQRELNASIKVLKAGDDEINQMKAKLTYEQQFGDSVGAVTARQIQLAQVTMDLHTLQGKSNSDEMIALEALRIMNQAQIDQQHELGLMFKQTETNMSKMWQSFGNGVADSILAGGKFWSFWHNVIHQFEQDMLRTLVNGVLKTLKDQLLSIPGVAGTLGKVFGGLGGSSSSQLPGGVMMGPPEATAAQVAALGANTTATVADTTTTGTNAAATTTDTAATIANAAVTTADVIGTGINTVATGANTIAVGANTIGHATSTISYNLASGLNTSATVANTAAVAANTAATVEASAQSGIESAASGAGGIAGAAGSVASAGLGAIVNVVTGVVTAISSVVGNFQMAGMNKTLDLIENYTRYLKIGLVEQGDSLLNDSHVIRNTLTDFMAYNWGVQASYFQQICEKLDTLIAGGGVTGLLAPQSLAATAGGPGLIDIPTGANAASDNSVTVDLRGSNFSGGVTADQVDKVFSKGIDRAKRAGAFRSGTWPR